MSAVGLEWRDNLAILQLDDGAKNVINHEVLDELEAAWAEVEEKAGAVVFAGRPGSFCAGYDLSVMVGDDPQAAGRLGQRGGRFAYTLYSSPVPSVAVSTGHAFTIGAVWLACCDVRIGERGNFKYAMREVALGVAFSRWPLAPLEDRLQRDAIVPALLHSETYDPEGAQRAGFVDELVEPGAGVETGITKASALSELPRAAYHRTKMVMRQKALAEMAEDLKIEG